MLSPDPIIPDAANPQSLNRYSYVLNNPLKYTDPSGHSPRDWWEELKRRADQFVRNHTHFASTPKTAPPLSSEEELTVNALNTTALAADIVALGLSSAGATVELGLMAVDTVSPVGDVGGLGLYYEIINPWENAFSLVAFGSTIAGDTVEGLNYLQLDPLEIGIGQDTLVSTGGILLGNVVPLEGILDTAVNIPLVWYDAQGAAGNISTRVEFRYNKEEGWYFIIYPKEESNSSDE